MAKKIRQKSRRRPVPLPVPVSAARFGIFESMQECLRFLRILAQWFHERHHRETMPVSDCFDAADGVEEIPDAEVLREGLPDGRVGMDLNAVRDNRDRERGAVLLCFRVHHFQRLFRDAPGVQPCGVEGFPVDCVVEAGFAAELCTPQACAGEHALVLGQRARVGGASVPVRK